MSFSEYLQYCFDNNINIANWKILKLFEKVRSGKTLTPSETCAKLFLEEMGYYSWLADQEKLEQQEQLNNKKEKRK